MNIFGVIGWKDSGKTGLMERLVSEMTNQGFKISTLKHAHHSFDIDHQGRDSFRHRQAGASEVMLSSNNRWALMHEFRVEEEPSFAELITMMKLVDLILGEGFTTHKHYKLPVQREETEEQFMHNTSHSVSSMYSVLP